MGMWKLIGAVVFGIYSANAGNISGRVISAINGSPIIGANVFIDGTSFGSSTNHRGEFSITDIPDGEYTLTVTYVGYRLKNPLDIRLSGNADVFHIIEMEENLYESESIVVTGSRTKRLIKDSPVTTEVIQADEIKNLGAENVGEVLEAEPELAMNFEMITVMGGAVEVAGNVGSSSSIENKVAEVTTQHSHQTKS